MQRIGALDEDEHLTALGRRILDFTTHPRLAKVLVYATLFQCVDPVVSIVAGLAGSRLPWEVTENKDMARENKRKFHPTSDHLALYNLMKDFRQLGGRFLEQEFCTDARVNPRTLYFLKGNYLDFI